MSYPFLPKFSQKIVYHDGAGNEEGCQVGDGLGELQTGETQLPGQEVDQRDEHALAADGQDGGPDRLAQGLEEHIGEGEHRPQ